MKRVWVALRYSGIGVFCVGIIGVIQGCSVEREGALFAVLLLLLNFCSGPVAEDVSPAAPASPVAVVLYGAGVQDGIFGGRAGADALCVTARPAGLPAEYTNFHAFLSVENTTPDQMIDMPANYGVPTNLPITGPIGTLIADNWAHLMVATAGNPVHNSLRDAGVTIETNSVEYWTGSDGTGNLGITCTGWTVPGANNGNTGVETSTSGNVIGTATAGCGGGSAFIELVCVGF